MELAKVLRIKIPGKRLNYFRVRITGNHLEVCFPFYQPFFT